MVHKAVFERTPSVCTDAGGGGGCGKMREKVIKTEGESMKHHRHDDVYNFLYRNSARGEDGDIYLRSLCFNLWGMNLRITRNEKNRREGKKNKERFIYH